MSRCEDVFVCECLVAAIVWLTIVLDFGDSARVAENVAPRVQPEPGNEQQQRDTLLEGTAHMNV